MTEYQRPVASIIAARDIDGRPHVLLQKRAKDYDDTPYSGYLELPQGKVRQNESLIQAATRELEEETGLEVAKVLIGAPSRQESHNSISRIAAFQPLICVEDCTQNHLGIALVVQVAGQPRTSNEATGHQWYSTQQLRSLIESAQIFPLNVPMLKKYLHLLDEREGICRSSSYRIV